mmetsp:Transcript_355/g.1236  ORF Transcript_355/g.1236 Transcript_355/m.1236 type:complete len:203 (+) Transcript_355:619-1227(+)
MRLRRLQTFLRRPPPLGRGCALRASSSHEALRLKPLRTSRLLQSRGSLGGLRPAVGRRLVHRGAELLPPGVGAPARLSRGGSQLRGGAGGRNVLARPGRQRRHGCRRCPGRPARDLVCGSGRLGHATGPVGVRAPSLHEGSEDLAREGVRRHAPRRDFGERHAQSLPEGGALLLGDHPPARGAVRLVAKDHEARLGGGHRLQ